MKYSEAIRLGSMLGPQAFGTGYGEGGAICANRGACIAVGQPAGAIFEVFPGSRQSAACPVCSSKGRLASVIADCLNDRHEWTRERIADWLAASGHDFEIELAKAPEPAAVSEVCA